MVLVVQLKMEPPVAEPETAIPPYENVTAAPIIYFDFVAANGMMNGAIEIELAYRNLIPNTTGGLDVRLATSARIRFSPAAAMALKAAIDNSLAMLQPNPQQPVASPGKLN
jgi:hypothetical protein